MDVILNAVEMAELFIQDPATKNDGGFQSLLVRLQGNCDQATGALTLTPTDLDRIKKYAFDYGNGGWENRLVTIFGRHLGPGLDRTN